MLHLPVAIESKRRPSELWTSLGHDKPVKAALLCSTQLLCTEQEFKARPMPLRNYNIVMANVGKSAFVFPSLSMAALNLFGCETSGWTEWNLLGDDSLGRWRFKLALKTDDSPNDPMIEACGSSDWHYRMRCYHDIFLHDCDVSEKLYLTDEHTVKKLIAYWPREKYLDWYLSRQKA